MAGGAITSSISWRSTHLVGSVFKNKYTLGQIVVDIIFVVAIVSLLFLTASSKKIFDINPATSDGLFLGFILLIMWYSLTIIDLFLHEVRIAVSYNYFFIDVPITALKFCAEALLVLATFRIVVLHLQQQFRKAKMALVFGETLYLGLVVTAAYSLGSLVARQIVWLQLADSKTRNSFAWPQRNFEAAFYCIQFCMGSFATVLAGLNGWMAYQAARVIPLVAHRVFWAALSLWIWCTSELAFVLKYHLRNHPPAKDTALARDTIYGLFNLIFLILLTFDGSKMTNKGEGAGSTAPLPENLKPLLEDMKAAYRTYVVQQLQTRTQENEKPPPFADFIGDLRRHRTAPFRRRIREERGRLDARSLGMVDEKCAEYVTELEERYGELVCNQFAREE